MSKQLPYGPGVHSLVPMHTTHKHIEGFQWVQGKESLHTAWRYASGQAKPNHLMPAIIYSINYGEMWLSIWNVSCQSQHYNKPWYPERVLR